MNNRRLHAVPRVSQAQPSTSATSTTAAPTASAAAPTPNFISTSGGPFWVPFGPAPSGTASLGDVDQDYGPAIGRTTVVVVDQSDSTGNTVYIGGAAGGLWKSTNAANANVQNCNTVSVSQAPYCAPSVTWTPLLDQQASLTVGAMAIQPGNPQWLVVGTGEANNSADSYYGLGFLVSQDGGATWTLVSSAKSADGASTIDLHGLGATRIAFSSENISVQNLTTSTVVASMAATAGGLAVGAEFATVGSVTPRGLYFSKDAGLSWQRATACDLASWTPPSCPAASTPDTGSANSVLYNPFTHLFYANLRYHGFYSSPDGQYWTRLASQPLSSLGLANCPSTPTSTNCLLYRAEMAIVPGRAGTSGKGEMYVWIVSSNDSEEGIFQSLDGGTTWTTLSTIGIDTCGDGANGSCGTTQGTYNLTLLAVPNGSAATDLYAGAVNQYRCALDPVLNPTCAAKPFANLTHTYFNCGGGAGAFAHVHPDQHGIDFLHANPDILYFGNDGGIYRTLHSQTGTPATQNCNGVPQPWIQYDNLSGTMGSMMQFVGFSQSPSDATVLLGGTQDNGSMAKNSSSPATTLGNGTAAGYSWQSVNNGDGGFNDINPISPQEWFASNPHVSVQQCINGSGITCTAAGFNEIVNSSKVGNDNAPFYMAYMLDPQAANHLLVGTCRLWRIDRTANLATTWPTSNAITYNLDQFATAGLSACSSNASNTVSAIAAGGPCHGVCNSATNGTGNGSQVIYLGTHAGRVFVTTNADGGLTTWADRTSGLPSALSCNNSPCPISGIALDPADPTGNTAYVTVMGFKINHVFKTTNAGASWTNIDGSAGGTGLPDSPADAVVVDPNQAGLVYVATDVGVFKSLGDGNWTEVGPTTGSGSLPNVATTALRVYGTGAATRLRVSTYGRGVWEIPIPNVHGFQFVVSPIAATVNIQQSATLNGSITPFNGYNSPVNLQCTSVPANVACTPTVTSINTAAGTSTFSVTLAGTVAGTYNLTLTAVGTDPAVVTQQQAITLTVVVPQGLMMSAPAQATAPAGSVAGTSFNLTSTNGFNGPVTLACTGLPATAGPCVFSPAIPNLPLGATANVNVTIPTGTTPASTAPYPFTITASSPNSQTATAATSLLVTVPPDFTMGALAPVSPSTVSAGLTGTTSFTLTANSTFSGNVTFACSGLPANAGPCSFTPAPATLSVNQATTVTVDIPTTTSVTPGTYTVTVTSTSGSLVHSQSTALTIGGTTNTFEVSNPVQFSTSIAKVGQVLTGATASVRSSAFSGTVNLSCAVTPSTNAGICSVTPGTVSLTAGSSSTVSLSLNTFGATVGNYSVTVSGASGSATSTAAPFNYSVTDYAVSAGAATPILPAGSTSVNVTLAAQNGYTGTVTASCNVGTAPLTCSLSPLGPYSVSGAPVSLLATITGPGSSITTAAGSYTVTLQTSDAGFPTLAHNAATTATIQDYKLTTTDPTGAVKSSATVTAGQSSTFTVNVVPQAGVFSGNVTFDAAAVCNGLPSKSSCTLNGLSSGMVTVPSGGTATLVISTTAATTTTAALPVQHRGGTPLFAFWTMLPAGFFLGFGNRRRSRASRRRGRGLQVLFVLAVAMLATLVACGGGGGGTTTAPPPIPVPGTPAGSSTVTIISSSGSGSTTITRTAQITLTVQ